MSSHDTTPEDFEPSPFRTVVISDRGPAVVSLTLTRPHSLNSLTAQTLSDLAAASAVLSARKDLAVVVVKGDGPGFSAGADFELLAGLDDGETIDPREAALLGGAMADAIEVIPAVTVAKLRGAVVGGGLVLAAACDLRIAAEDTHFSIPEVDIGLPLGWGGVPRLAREMGLALTRELVMTCRPFSADEAFRAGFLNRVVPAIDLDGEVDALVSQLAAKPRYGLLAVKAAISDTTEGVAAARNRVGDADLLAGAFTDPDSRSAAARYLDGRT
jgi:enoyl-CoA hydratase/carnithine racemase